MSAVLNHRHISNTLHKMDNVLYEIKDNNGITRNYVYEDWKIEVIKDLEAEGYIEVVGDLYVLTAEGKEVIQHDSLVYYNKNVKLKKVEESPLTTKEFSYSFGLVLIVLGLLSTVVIWSELKFQWISAMF